MKRRTLLELINVPNPCDKSWDEMTGDNQTRLCSHCDKNIHNLAEMSAKDVQNLLSHNKGRVCVRMTRDADGKVVTNDRKFHQIKRKSRFATNILSITLAISTITSAQTQNTGINRENTGINKQNTSYKNKKTNVTLQNKEQNLLTLTLTDSTGAIVPNAQVKIINLETKIEQTGRTNDIGELKFVIEKLGNYEIVVNGIAGFKELKKTVELTKENLKMTLRLDFEDIIVGTTTSTIATTITGRPMEELPKSNNIFLGLVLETKEQQKLRQKTSQISFTISDQTGAIIPNAEVKLTNDKTKKEFIVNTNEQGVAYFSFLPRGRYKIEVFAKYFRKSQRNILLEKEVEPNINLTLEVFAVGEVVIINLYEIPIFYSVIQGDFETVKTYISLGENINIKDKPSGKTMLHVAVENDNLEIVKLLIDARANINAKDKIGRTPILLVDLSEENSLEIIKLLIGKGANLNIQNKDDNNQTLLMSACDDDNFEIVKLLLEAGANPNLKDDDGETAMMKTTSEEIKTLLKQYGTKN